MLLLSFMGDCEVLTHVQSRNAPVVLLKMWLKGKMLLKNLFPLVGINSTLKALNVRTNLLNLHKKSSASNWIQILCPGCEWFPYVPHRSSRALYSLSWRYTMMCKFLHNYVLFFIVYATKTAGSIFASAFRLLHQFASCSSFCFWMPHQWLLKEQICTKELLKQLHSSGGKAQWCPGKCANKLSEKRSLRRYSSEITSTGNERMECLAVLRKCCRIFFWTVSALQEQTGLGKQWSPKQGRQCYYLCWTWTEMWSAESFFEYFLDHAAILAYL